MNKILNRIPFALELFINGFFIFLYSFYRINKIETTLFDEKLIGQVIGLLGYVAPMIIFAVMVSNYLKSGNLEDFLRNYIFSIIVFVPLAITYGDIEFAFWLSSVHLFSTVLSLYDTKESQTKKKRKQLFKGDLLDRITLAPAQIVILSFSGIILFGTLMLMLPISSAEGKSINFIDALFTATSATCVTGLTTLSIAQNFSFIGQIIVLALIQVGGLGYMTLFSAMTILLGRSLAVKDQVLISDLLDISSFEDMLSMIIDIVKYTIVIELFGAIVLTVAFSFEGYDFGQSLMHGIFHSISAFCNAGFALFDNSLVNFQTNPLINVMVGSLIVLGGLGFIVIKDIEQVIRKEKKIVNLSVHSKIVLVTNMFLIAGVALYIFFSEYLNSLVEYSFFNQIQISLFQSITTRTAGFNTIGLDQLQSHTIYLFTLFMFIGASPGSTGGGIKTTTFAILFQSVKATLKGRDSVEFFDKTIPNNLVVRAIAIIVISLIMVSMFILLMIKLEPEHSFLSIFFEVVSAFGTVGLSLGITPYLSLFGKLAIIVLMFCGRVGPLTLVLALGKRRESEGAVDLPTGRVMIG